MARIRSVHPELFTDEAFCSLSPLARLLYIGIWTLCDDRGVFEWKPFGMKINLLPIDAADVEALLGELSTQRQIKSFDIEGKTYGAVRNFCIFQRPKKPVYKHPFPDWCRTYVALDRRKTEDVGNEFPTSGENRPHGRGEEGSRRGEESNTDREKPVVVVVPDENPKTTTTTGSKIASQGRQAGISRIMGRPLPEKWVPDDTLCEKVSADFGMSLADVNLELPAFHALNLQNGTLSQDWGATFYLFAKQWKVRQERGAPRLELTKSKSEPISSAMYTPTERDWEGAAMLYAQTGRWSAQFGPDPMSPSCRCPPEILTRHIQNPEAIPVLKASKRKVTA